MIEVDKLSSYTKKTVKEALEDYRCNRMVRYLELKNSEKNGSRLTFTGLAYISVFAALLDEEHSNEPHMRYGRNFVEGYRTKDKGIPAY